MATLLGRKLGMTELFDEAGHRVPVTMVEAGPVVVVDRKTPERDGYEAVRLGFGAIKERRVGKALRGVYAKAGVAPRRHLREVRGPAAAGAEPGQTLTAEAFAWGIGSGRPRKNLASRAPSYRAKL
jgi:large subunit ribosomal protein L3